MWCDEEDWAAFCDSEDGARVGDGLPSALRFLRPESPLPSVPNRQPWIWIKINTDLLTLNPKRELEAAPENALWHSGFLLLLRGVRCGSELFLEDEDGDFFNAKSGEWIWPQKDIPGAAKRHFILLLREGPVPHIVFPSLRPSFFLRREGVVLRMEKGRVRSVGPPQPADIGRWSFVWTDDDFYKQFVAAAEK